jgi:hypothetical protein
MTHDGHIERPGDKPGDAQSDARLERELDALFELLEIEAAPPSLTRRLQRIPLEQAAPEPWWRRLLPTGQGPRWILVPALAAALLVVGVMLTMPRQPSQAEVLQARHDLAVAFSYIDKAGLLTEREIHSVLEQELSNTVKDNLSKHIPFTEQSRKEETT